MATQTLNPGGEPDILADGTVKVDAAVKLSSLCRSTLYKAMDSGELAYVVPPGTRCRRIPKLALMAFLRRGLVNQGN